jgi:hypothetical protein
MLSVVFNLVLFHCTNNLKHTHRQKGPCRLDIYAEFPQPDLHDYTGSHMDLAVQLNPCRQLQQRGRGRVRRGGGGDGVGGKAKYIKILGTFAKIRGTDRTQQNAREVKKTIIFLNYARVADTTGFKTRWCAGNKLN